MNRESKVCIVLVLLFVWVRNTRKSLIHCSFVIEEYVRKHGGISKSQSPVTLQVTVIASVSFTRYPSSQDTLTTVPSSTELLLYCTWSVSGRGGHVSSNIRNKED